MRRRDTPARCACPWVAQYSCKAITKCKLLIGLSILFSITYTVFYDAFQNKFPCMLKSSKLFVCKASFISAKQKVPNQEVFEVQKGAFWRAAWLSQVATLRRSKTWQFNPRATRWAGKISRQNQSSSCGKWRLMYAAAPQGKVAGLGQSVAIVAPDSTMKRSMYSSQAHFWTKLFWIHMADHECIHWSNTSFEQELNIIPGLTVQTRWPNYMTLNANSSTLK